MSDGNAVEDGVANFGHHGGRGHQPLHDGATGRIREGAEHGVEIVVKLRHVPDDRAPGGSRQPITGPS
jgi:hypothetical protein